MILTAEVAVSGITPGIDIPYTYSVPEKFADKIFAGARVNVPFGRGNKTAGGFVLSLGSAEKKKKLKEISFLYDKTVSLSGEDILTASFLKSHCFCTFFEAANVLLPPGIWGQNSKVYSKGELSLREALSVCLSDAEKTAIVNAIFASNKPVSEKNLPQHSDSALKELCDAGVIKEQIRIEGEISDSFVKMLSLAVSFDEICEKIPDNKRGSKSREILKCLGESGFLPEKELCYLTGASASTVKRLEREGFIKSELTEIFRRPTVGNIIEKPEVTLNEDQQAALSELEALCDGKARGALLYGVTGSGKTEVYISLIKSLRKKGKSAILLVPEIALTPQMVRRFHQSFRDDVAIVHSALTASQRYDEYKRIKSGQAHIVVGTRSAVFAPLSDIGVIIIDEEQEYTYKSENSPKYHAADVAKFRATKHNCLVLFGSATPSVSTMYAAKQGKIALVSLKSRFNENPLPKTIISDMRGKISGDNAICIGPELAAEIEKNLARKEKTILFLNRRGAANKVICVDCGYIPKCKNCSVSLIYHSKNNRLLCHHCGYSEQLPEICPDCGSEHIKHDGIGTQLVENELKALFPKAEIIRMDADTIVGRTSHEKILDDFAKSGDILIGTQMVAKGLDFDDVTLVGVIDADGFMYSEDFRAQERAFSLITQVVGRAGRRDKPGRAVIQTYSPQNPVINTAAKQDYDSFYDYEIDSRKAINAPPFCDIFSFTVSGLKEERVIKAASSLAATLTNAGIDVLGPVPAVISKLNNHFRYYVSMRGINNQKLRGFISDILNSFAKSKISNGVSVSVDINTYS